MEGRHWSTNSAKSQHSSAKGPSHLPHRLLLEFSPKNKPNPEPSSPDLSPRPITPSPLNSKLKKPLLAISPSSVTPSPTLESKRSNKPVLVIGANIVATNPSSDKKPYGLEVVNRRVKVYWPLEKSRYKGCVKSYVKRTSSSSLTFPIRKYFLYYRDRRDANGRRPGDVNYDPRTLYLPPNFVKSLSSGQTSATHNSLVALDELGRGTSTSDGQAIAASVLEHFVHAVQCRGMFSTHYHRLAIDYQKDTKVFLCHMACQVGKGDSGLEEVLFLYKLTPGACPKSYGVNVARLAGLPDSVLQKAAVKSQEFEDTYGKKSGAYSIIQDLIKFASSKKL